MSLVLHIPILPSNRDEQGYNLMRVMGLTESKMEA